MIPVVSIGPDMKKLGNHKLSGVSVISNSHHLYQEQVSQWFYWSFTSHMTAIPTAYDQELSKSHNFSCACSTVGSMDMKHPPYNKYYLKISEEHQEFMYLNQVPGISEKMYPPQRTP